MIAFAAICWAFAAGCGLWTWYRFRLWTAVALDLAGGVLFVVSIALVWLARRAVS